jgi:Flp pilus assembly protein TadG
MVEYAIVIPIMIMLLAGLAIFGLGVFRYQQVALLAREGARYASVHGGQYQSVTGSTAADATAVYNNAIKPQAAGLNLSLLSYSVAWDDASKNPVYLSNPATNTYRINNVTVTVSYTWTPEAFWGSTTLSSTSKMPITF